MHHPSCPGDVPFDGFMYDWMHAHVHLRLALNGVLDQAPNNRYARFGLRYMCIEVRVQCMDYGGDIVGTINS